MSTLTANSAVANEAISSPTMAEPPPIMLVLPLLQAVLSGSSSLFRLGLRLLLTLAAPLYLILPVAYTILSPVILMMDIALNVLLLSPLSLIRWVVVALYPFYVFCAVACITGAVVGILGRYLVATVLDSLAQTEFFRPEEPPPAAPPSNQHPALRRRKRKSVRIQ